MPNALYFAYGSNLNVADWELWCSDQNYPDTAFDVSFKKVANAWLPDYRLGFTVRSKSRSGGVLDIVEAKGGVTPGVLFEVNEDGIVKLDHKEGAPHFYKRLDIVVQTAEEIQKAFTYQVVSPQGDFIPPSEEYARIVCEGHKANELDDEHIRNATNGKEATATTHVFVYGTLRTGGWFAGNLANSPYRPAQVRGRLYNLGWYPGLYLDRDADPVFGEVVTITPKTLVQLDKIESEYSERSLYHRIWLPKELWGSDGGCWTYVYAKPESNLSKSRRILSGDWCNR